MGKTRRKFSLEFKQQILAEIASGQKSLSQQRASIRSQPA